MYFTTGNVQCTTLHSIDADGSNKHTIVRGFDDPHRVLVTDDYVFVASEQLVRINH